MSVSSTVLNYDLKNAIAKNRLLGLWRLMHGFQWKYIIATVSIGFAAVAKTCTYLLLRYFVDNAFTEGGTSINLPLVALGFILLAGAEGGFTFLSGRFAAQTAEGVTRRLRNYLFDHIQHLSFTYHSQTDTGELIQRSTSDVDALRRFYADQAIGAGAVFQGDLSYGAHGYGAGQQGFEKACVPHSADLSRALSKGPGRWETSC